MRGVSMSSVWHCGARALVLLLIMFVCTVPGALTESKPEEKTTLCYECLNYDDKGNYYDQCPMHGNVSADRAYLGKCTGSCFTHTDDLRPTLVVRGCTTNLYGLPKPLPPDGCYPWYSEVWCVCTTDRCNGVQLGTPTTDEEFDAHIPEGEGGGDNANGSRPPGPMSLHVHLLCLLVLTAALGRD